MGIGGGVGRGRPEALGWPITYSPRAIVGGSRQDKAAYEANLSPKSRSRERERERDRKSSPSMQWVLYKSEECVSVCVCVCMCVWYDNDWSFINWATVNSK